MCNSSRHVVWHGHPWTPKCLSVTFHFFTHPDMLEMKKENQRLQNIITKLRYTVKGVWFFIAVHTVGVVSSCPTPFVIGNDKRNQEVLRSWFQKFIYTIYQKHQERISKYIAFVKDYCTVWVLLFAMLGYVKIYIYTTVVLDHTFPGYAAFTCAFSSGSKAHSVKENFLGINVCSFF